MIKCKWSEVKQFLDERLVSAQFIEFDSYYYVVGLDGRFEIYCEIMKDGNSDQVDFEANYKNSGNKQPRNEVTTQFERKDFDLKIFCGSADVNATTGEAHILIKVPGTSFRYFGGGEAFFDKADIEDKITKLQIIDHDNILGYGVDTVIKSYVDDEADEDNRGWFVGIDEYGYNGNNSSYIELEPMGFYGEAPSGLYLHVVGKKDSSNKTGKFFINVFSGKRS